MSKEKVLNICRYFLAIPAGVLGYLASVLMCTLSSKLYPEYYTVLDWLINFIWANFGHLLAFFWALNLTLPNHKFVITLIVSTILSTLFIILFILYIYLNILTAEIIFAFILNLLAFIISPILSYRNIFENLN